jgi:hypothetical protein
LSPLCVICRCSSRTNSFQFFRSHSSKYSTLEPPREGVYFLSLPLSLATRSSSLCAVWRSCWKDRAYFQFPFTLVSLCACFFFQIWRELHEVCPIGDVKSLSKSFPYVWEHMTSLPLKRAGGQCGIFKIAFPFVPSVTRNTTNKPQTCPCGNKPLSDCYI